jgi:hypothetical protein
MAEHTRKCLKGEYLSRIEYDFKKPHVTGPYDHKHSVYAKKVLKKYMIVSVNKCLLSPPALLDSQQPGRYRTQRGRTAKTLQIKTSY